jgi:hypothetical protein
MSQNPLKVDQLQIEPGAAGTRLINKAVDGSLQFTDAVVTGGLTLKQLAGLRNVANTLIVGKSGAGAAYTTLQSALDAVPAGASALNPYFILVGPGVYSETINIVRDGVTVIGCGAVINAAELVADGPGAYHTVTIQAALGTIPRIVNLINLEIGNIHQNYACVRVAGAAASNVGRIGITLTNCTLKASSAAGNRPIWVSSANFITMEGGRMDCTSSALTFIEECASFLLKNVTRSSALQLDWDNTGDLPSAPAESYTLTGCTDVGYGNVLTPIISSTLSVVGALNISDCTGQPTISLAGSRATRVVGSDLGAVTLAGSVTLRLTGSSHGTVTPGGTATLEEPAQRGIKAFVGVATGSVVFTAPQPDANYTVSLDTDAHPASNDVAWVTAKTAAGFTINFSNVQTLGVSWLAQREVRN